MVTSTLPRVSSSGSAASVTVPAAALRTCSLACSSLRRTVSAGQRCGASSMIVVGLSPEPAITPASREANLPWALPSTTSSRRSRFGTKPRASSSSRSSRSRSAWRSGSRRSAQRSIGGIAMVVIIAMATISVNRFLLNTPADSAIEATITSVEPRAFMAQASASDSAAGEAAELAADEGAGELSDAGDDDQPDRQQQQFGVLEDGEIGAQPGQAEEHRHEQRGDQAAELLVDVPGQDRRFADQHAGDEGAEHGVHADQIGRQRHRDRDQEDHGDDRKVAGEMVVGPADQVRTRRAGRR